MSCGFVDGLEVAYCAGVELVLEAFDDPVVGVDAEPCGVGFVVDGCGVSVGFEGVDAGGAEGFGGVWVVECHEPGLFAGVGLRPVPDFGGGFLGAVPLGGVDVDGFLFEGLYGHGVSLSGEVVESAFHGEDDILVSSGAVVVEACECKSGEPSGADECKFGEP